MTLSGSSSVFARFRFPPEVISVAVRWYLTHRFHPLFGRDFEFVAYRQDWGEDRVHLHDENGVLFSLPAGWTDVVPADPFVVVADGRCSFTAGGLLALAELIDGLRSLSAVRAENLVHGSDQQGCSPGRSAVMITDHVPAVRVPPDYAGHRGVVAVAA